MLRIPLFKIIITILNKANITPYTWYLKFNPLIIWRDVLLHIVEQLHVQHYLSIVLSAKCTNQL